MTVRLELAEPIATIVLARPDARNALTEDMGTALRDVIGTLQASPNVRAVIVRGDGHSFSAGGDLRFIEDRLAASPEDNRRTMRAFYELYLGLRTLRAPTIAALHGTAIGAGVCLALACDLRIAATDATLALNFVRLGLHPGMGATLLLPRLVGVAKAAELLLTGKPIDAREALRIGIVSSIHAPDTLIPAAVELASTIAEAAPRAVASTTRALRSFGADELDAWLETEAREQAIDYASPDVAEGVRAVRERRPPVFR